MAAAKKKPSLKITLVVNKETLETKTYQEKFVSGLAFRSCLAFGLDQEVKTSAEEGPNELEQMDGLVELVASLFSNEAVTAESIWGGLSFDEVAEVCGDIVSTVLNGGQNGQVEPAGK